MPVLVKLMGHSFFLRLFPLTRLWMPCDSEVIKLFVFVIAYTSVKCKALLVGMNCTVILSSSSSDARTPLSRWLKADRQHGKDW